MLVCVRGLARFRFSLECVIAISLGSSQHREPAARRRGGAVRSSGKPGDQLALLHACPEQPNLLCGAQAYNDPEAPSRQAGRPPPSSHTTHTKRNQNSESVPRVGEEDEDQEGAANTRPRAHTTPRSDPRPNSTRRSGGNPARGSISNPDAAAAAAAAQRKRPGTARARGAASSHAAVVSSGERAKAHTAKAAMRPGQRASATTSMRTHPPAAFACTRAQRHPAPRSLCRSLRQRGARSCTANPSALAPGGHS